MQFLSFWSLVARRLGWVAASLWLSGCASVGAPSASKVKAASPDVPENIVWSAAVTPAGAARLVFYDEQNQLNVMDEGGKITRPFHPQGHERASSGLAVEWLGDRPFVAFRDKHPERNVYVADLSGNEPPIGLDPGNLPLARVALVPRNGQLGVVWFGEKAIDGETYNIFYQQLDALGRPQLKEPVRLFPGIYPVAVSDATGRLVALSWMKSADGAGYQIVARVSLTGGDFEPPVKVADTSVIRPIFQAIHTGRDFLALWSERYLKEDGESAYRLAGARSPDGKSWTKLAMADMAGHDIESLDIASDGAGHVAVAFAAVQPGESVAKGKRWVYLMTSADHGQTWSSPMNLRQDPLQAEQPYSHARTPKVAYTAPGRLLVAWQDWRTLRAGIRYSYSEDGGKSWRIQDQALIGGQDRNIRFYFQGKGIFPTSDGRVIFAVEELDGDRLAMKSVQLREFSLQALIEPSGQRGKAPAPREDRLRERAEAYWRALASRDLETVYGMFDPFFRARVSFDDYKRNAGRIEYSRPEISKVDVLGPLGMVVSKVTVEVKPFTVQGRTMKLDPVEKEVPSRWIWIDGDWYNEFYLESRDFRYTAF